MTVLVATASRHGSTREVGAAVVRVLREQGLNATQRDAESLLSELDSDPFALSGFQAVVIGSAVYTGTWLTPATRLMKVAQRSDVGPVFGFSVGIKDITVTPLDAPWTRPIRAGEPLVPVVFGGRLEMSVLSMRERSLLAVVRAKEGSYTQWDMVEAWSRIVARQLVSTSR